SDAGANKIRPDLDYATQIEFDIEVTAGTLSLTGASHIHAQIGNLNPQFLAKTGAGTLLISGLFGGKDSVAANFEQFVVEQGLVSMASGGQLRTNLRIEDGAIVRLQQGGDQIANPVVPGSGFPGESLEVTIDAGGV